MIYVRILACVLVFGLAACASDAGQSSENAAKALGGFAVKPNTALGNAICRMELSAGHVCACTLIKSNIILTSAHCFDHAYSSKPGIQRPDQNKIRNAKISVTFGHQQAQSFRVEAVMAIEGRPMISTVAFNRRTPLYDVAVAKLDGAVSLPFRPVDIINPGQRIEGPLLFLGLGLPSFSPIAINYAGKHVATNQQAGLSTYYSSDAQQTCGGDSGGGLFNYTRSTNKLVQIGVIASAYRVIDAHSPCNPGLTVVDLNDSSLNRWINNAINKLNTTDINIVDHGLVDLPIS